MQSLPQLTSAELAGRQRLIRLTLRAAAASTLRSPKDPQLSAQLIARARTLTESLARDARDLPDDAIAHFALESARHFAAELATLSQRAAQSESA
ncbi:MAG: hypothetical protein ABI881_06550 [Betaproteobacteria bacterium]